ncbi:MAG: RNA 2',3'-cyclic phosphodiesterase [Crenarchaeota archaeon]|nr:RNA 2',3'-cyclic phosphodiesterase [Thermoproteota archaeon]MDA1125062.1 RNA 2',3'-cyclic phosphodiesterase [Thermoproteota archaeon]
MRVFVAVEISNQEVLKNIHIFQKNIQIDAKPTKIDQIHFTLEFLGEIDQVKCDQVKEVLKKISFSSFDVSLKGVGGFPNLKNPRVIWIGIDKNGAEKLISIANEIEMKLTTLGFENEKKFKPHLTIFRVKDKINDISGIMKEHENIEFGTQTISKIKVKRSVLSPKGPEYSDLLEVNAK